MTGIALIWLGLRKEDMKKAWKWTWTSKLQKPQSHDFNTTGWNEYPTRGHFSDRNGGEAELKSFYTYLLRPSLILHWSLLLTCFYQCIFNWFWSSSTVSEVASQDTSPILHCVWIPSRFHFTLKNWGRGFLQASQGGEDSPYCVFGVEG